MVLDDTSVPSVPFSTSIEVQECPLHEAHITAKVESADVPAKAVQSRVQSQPLSIGTESPSDSGDSSAEIPWDKMPISNKNKVSGLRASLKGLASLCKEKASLHDKAAKKYAWQNNVLQLTSIIVTSGATICAAISIAEQTWSGQLIVAILSSSSSATQAILRLLNPETKKEQHLATENRYTFLSRDIIVKLLSGSMDEHFWESTLKDTQRILDNIEAIAPDV